MVKDLWLNLPVKDINKSKNFFSQLGFSFNKQYNAPNAACLLVGEKKVVVMLFEEPVFKGFTGKDIANTEACEVLISIGAATKEDVDMMAEKAVAAGGRCNHQPHEMTGWMYGCVFTDPDGHSWNVLYMDMTKMSQ